MFVFPSSSGGDSSTADALSLERDDNVAQGLLDCLSVLPIGAAKLGTTLQHHLTALFPPLALAIRSRFPVIRYAASKAFAALCDIVPSEGLRHLIESVIPFINDPLNESNRRGPIEVISRELLSWVPVFLYAQSLLYDRYCRITRCQDPPLCNIPCSPGARAYE